MSRPRADRRIVVHGTEVLSSDARQRYREKIARITLDSMVQFVGLLDASGTVLEINKVALDAVGISLSEVEGKPFWTTFWWQVSKEINQGLRDAIARAAKGEFVRWDTPIYGRSGGKETIIIDASLMPVVDESGTVVFIAAEGRDITEKKAQEREIAQKNVELQGLLERIRELDEIKTQFFANVSHELRTPLALILGPAQRLIDDDGRMGLAERKESGQLVARNARMLLKHVNDLLDMSKLEARKLTIDLQDTDVAALIRFLASHFAVLAADRQIAFTVDAGEPCVTAVDPDKLQRVLMNLLGNAFKFVPPGGRIRIALRPLPHDLVVAVDDSGPGVKADLRKAIFERFRQGDGGIDRKTSGTGLGLAIAKEFVELHRGEIVVLDSEFGGARFEVTIPRARVAADSGRPDAGATPTAHGRDDVKTILDGVIDELRIVPPSRRRDQTVVSGIVGRPRVLVVEDNPDMNRFVSECLGTQFEVISAFDGGEGIEQALRFRPLLVVSDIMMPHVSGVDMIARMRALPELRSTPILLLSAKADDELMVKLLENGAQDFVVKPFSERELLVRVRNLALTQQAHEQVNGLRQAAENANRAKDEFLAMLGHELRNPLSPILTALQLMKLRGEPGAERERTVIERQVNHLARLVDDLLDVARIARGRVELKSEIVEIADVVAKAIEMASPLLEQRNHRLTVEVPRRGLRVDGDPMRLSQVLSNLLTNAAKYTPSGGDVAIRAEHVGDEVVLSVRDTGIGIAADVLPRIFDLFVQDRQALDRSQGGLGIGLTIVRSLIERHGGSVAATSEGTGKGSEFVVRLPLAGRSQGIIAPMPAPGQLLEGVTGPLAAARVLIVDDNEDGAELLAEALAGKGYETRVAHDAPSALRVAADFSPDIAFLDIGLPVMDGYELAAHLRQMPGLAGLRLIAVTGYGQESDRQRARDAGFHHHLVKPVDIEAIEATLTSPNSGPAD